MAFRRVQRNQEARSAIDQPLTFVARQPAKGPLPIEDHVQRIGRREQQFDQHGSRRQRFHRAEDRHEVTRRTRHEHRQSFWSQRTIDGRRHDGH